MQASEILGEIPCSDSTSEQEVVVSREEDVRYTYRLFWSTIIGETGARASEAGVLCNFYRDERFRPVISVKNPSGFPECRYLFGLERKRSFRGHRDVCSHQLVRLRFYVTPYCRVIYRDNHTLLHEKDKGPLVSSLSVLQDPSLRVNGYAKYVFARDYGTYADCDEKYVTLARPWELLWKEKKPEVEENCVYGIRDFCEWLLDTRQRSRHLAQERELRATWHPPQTKNGYYVIPATVTVIDVDAQPSHSASQKRPKNRKDTSGRQKRQKIRVSHNYMR